MPGATNLLGLALAIGVPALIAGLAPRRWRVRLTILWALIPLVVLLGMGASEVVSGKTGTADFDKLIYGLLLIGSFLLLPWLASVGVGFAIGAILRGRRGIEAPPSPLPVVAAQPEAPAPPVPEIATTEASVAYAPPPSGPTLSVLADAASGESADGSLRYEHDLGAYAGGRFENLTPRARLLDARSGAVLFDGAAWPSSRVVPQADGSLLLSLHQAELQTLFRIDPAADAFQDLATAEASRPLADLAQAAAEARAAWDDPANTYLGRQVAPDGSFRVDLQAVEWSNTHWVRSPRVTEVATGRVVLDLWGTDWDAAVSFPRAKAVRLSFRRYHAGGAAEVELELGPDRYVLQQGEGVVFGPFADLVPALEAAARRAVANTPPRPAIPARRPTTRSWLVALAILIGTLALIAGATLVSLRLQGPPKPQHLDTIPPMPPTPGRP